MIFPQRFDPHILAAMHIRYAFQLAVLEIVRPGKLSYDSSFTESLLPQMQKQVNIVAHWQF
jgi:hypothetical protein